MDVRTGTPFWLARRTDVPPYAPLARDVTADVAIIGSGVTGAVVAYELASAGHHVVVVDAQDAAGGSSAASSGLLLHETDTSLDELIRRMGEQQAVRVYRLGIETIDRIEAICDAQHLRCGFARRPTLYLASSEADAAGLEQECALRRRHGFDVRWLSAGDVERRYGFQAPAGILSTGDAELDCYAFVRGLLDAAAGMGAGIYVRTPVTRLQATATGAVLDAGGCTIRATRVVCASGYQASEWLSRPTGTLASTWAMVTAPMRDFPGWIDRCLLWETARPYFYARTTDDLRALAGGEDMPGAERHTDEAKLREKSAKLSARLRALFPAIDAEIEYVWGGTFATTPDGLPFIGQVDGWPHVWFALAYGGNGITFSVVAAGLLRDAFGGQPSPDAALFSFQRRGFSSRPRFSA